MQSLEAILNYSSRSVLLDGKVAIFPRMWFVKIFVDKRVPCFSMTIHINSLVKIKFCNIFLRK